MDFQKDIAKDLKVEVKISGGKVFLTIEFDGADALLDGLKPRLPSWLSPLVDLAKGYVDAVPVV